MFTVPVNLPSTFVSPNVSAPSITYNVLASGVKASYSACDKFTMCCTCEPVTIASCPKLSISEPVPKTLDEINVSPYTLKLGTTTSLALVVDNPEPPTTTLRL